MDKKRSEGKHFYVYMIAGAAKFLRIYYATVTHYLRTIETPGLANRHINKIILAVSNINLSKTSFLADNR